jgi:hypothetical protein
MRIVVVVEGGCLRSVFCDDPEVQVELLDFDNAEESDGHEPPGEGQSVVEMDAALDLAESTMSEVF